MTKLTDCINFLLTNAQHTVFLLIEEDLAQFDITPAQYGVLKCIWEFDIHNPKDIADMLGLKNSTVSGILDRMEGKELLTREIDKNDRRFISVELTEKGKMMEEPVNKVVDKVNEKVFQSFNADEVSAIRSYLRRIIELKELI